MSKPTGTDLDHLLGLARAGDGSALGQLLERYRPYLALLARVQIGRRLQGKVDAADLVQETCLAAHSHFAQFQGGSEAELVAWLRQILASRLAKLIRHYCGTKRRDVRLERQLAVELDQSSRLLDRSLVAATSSPSQRAARREQAVLLADALDQLPDDYREVLILHHLQGLTLPEVAGRMGRTLDSVKNVWLRALARLCGTWRETPHEPHGRLSSRCGFGRFASVQRGRARYRRFESEVGRKSDIDLAAGDDFMLAFLTTFGGKTQILGGDDADFIDVESSTFGGKTEIDTGKGDDTLFLLALTFQSKTELNGGDGFDTLINDGNTFAVTPEIKGFET